MEKISVIITAFNIERYIEECVKSVLNQTFSDIKIICVNDNSSDNTLSILKNLQKKDSRIEVITNTKNMGLAASRVKGYELATGKYIYIMDGDDLLVPNALQILYEVSEKNQLDILSFSGKSFFDDNDMFDKYSSELNFYVRKGKYSNSSISGAELFSEYLNNGDMNGNLVFQFLRKDYILQKEFIGIEGIRYGESPLALYLTAERAMCIPNELYLRRFRKNSDVTTPYNSTKIASMIVQYNFDYSFYKTYAEKSKKYHKVLFNYLYYQFMGISSLCDKIPEIGNSDIFNNFPSAYYSFDKIIRESFYTDLISDAVLHKLKLEKSFIVFGNGKYASYLFKKFEKYGINNFIVATTTGEKAIETDQKVFCIDDLLDYRDKSLVLIAVGEVNKKAVCSLLKEKGFKRLQNISSF